MQQRQQRQGGEQKSSEKQFMPNGELRRLLQSGGVTLGDSDFKVLLLLWGILGSRTLDSAPRHTAHGTWHLAGKPIAGNMNAP